MKKTKMEKGITLVALIITVVVLLILAGISISEVRNARIISETQNTVDDFNKLQQTEQGMLNGLFNSVLGNNSSAPEDVFIWGSEDPNEEGYSTIIGYTANTDNYVSLRFPDRCTKIEITYLYSVNDEDTRREMRRYTGNIKEIELPSTITEIGAEAFSDYEFHSLVKITYDGTMEEWKNIIKGENWNDGVPAIYVQCTDGQVYLTSGAGYYPSENYEVTDLFIWASDDPTHPGYGMLVGYTSNVENYTTLTIPERCTKIQIDTSMLSNDINLIMRAYTQNIKEIELPDTITEIGSEAFYEYSFGAVKKINMPNSITTIGDYAFASCVSLSQIIYEGTKNEWDQIQCGTDIVSSLLQLVCSDGETVFGRDGSVLNCDITDLFIYASADPSNEGYGTIIGYTENVQNYTTLTIPDRCTKVEYDYNIMGDPVSNSGPRTYTGNIKEIELPETVTVIGDNAFYYHTFASLEKINIPNSVTKIGNSAFSGCSALTTINIPSSVNTIGYDAFWGCTSLNSIIYDGTIEQWKKIDKGDNWKYEVPATQVQCTDGNVSLE